MDRVKDCFNRLRVLNSFGQLTRDQVKLAFMIHHCAPEDQEEVYALLEERGIPIIDVPPVSATLAAIESEPPRPPVPPAPEELEERLQSAWSSYSFDIEKYPLLEEKYKEEIPYLVSAIAKKSGYDIYRHMAAAILEISRLRVKEKLAQGAWFCGTALSRQERTVLYWLKHVFSPDSLSDLMLCCSSGSKLSPHHQQMLLMMLHKAPRIAVRFRKLMDFLD